MALSSPSGALARVALLPDYSLQQDASLAAVSKVVQNNQQMAINQAKLAMKAAGGGMGGMSAKDGAYEWELDPTAPNGVRAVWVPGKTAKEREKNKTTMQMGMVNKAFQSDPAVQEKLAGLEKKSIDAQAKTLEDIRKNDLPRLFGDDRQAQQAIQQVLKPHIDRINQGRKAIEEEGMLSTLWDSLRIGTKKTLTGLQEIGEDEATKRQLNAELQAEVQNIVEKNPYLQEQRKREAEGQGFWDRSDGVGGLVQNALNFAGEDPTALATLGVSAALAPVTGGASLAAGAARYAIPAVIGGVIGAGTEGAEFVERTLDDPNLTDAQKSQALEEGFGQAAGVGAAFGGLSIPVGRAAGAAARTLSRTPLTATGRAVAKAATKEEATAILERAALQQAAKRATEGRLKRTARAVAENAAEAGLINVGDVIAQNVNYNAATGQDGSAFEGVPEAAAASLALGGAFGILGGGRRQPARTTPSEAAGGTPPAPATPGAGPSPTPGAPGSPTPRTGILTPEGRINPTSNAGRYFQTVHKYMTSGGKWDADQVVDNFLQMQGNDLTTLKAWLDEAPEHFERTFTPKRMTDLYDAAMRRDADGTVFTPLQTSPTAEYDKAAFAKRIRESADSEGIRAEVNALIRAGVDPEVIRNDVNDKSFKLKKEYKAAVTNVVDAHLATQRAEAQSGRQGSNGTGGYGPAASLMGSDGQGRTGAARLPDNQGDSGMAANPGEAPQALADAGTPELSGNRGTVEGGGAGGTPEPNVRPGEAIDANAASAGSLPAAGADGGRGLDAAAPRVPQQGAGAGSAGRADLGGEGGTQRAGSLGNAQSVDADLALAIQRAPSVAQIIPQFEAKLNPKERKKFYDILRNGVPDEGDIGWGEVQGKLAREFPGLTGQALNNFAEKVHADYATAKSLGVEATLDDLIKANANEAETINRVYSNLWCLTR